MHCKGDILAGDLMPEARCAQRAGSPGMSKGVPLGKITVSVEQVGSSGVWRGGCMGPGAGDEAGMVGGGAGRGWVRKALLRISLRGWIFIS